jgi:hypothetical protein
MPNDPIERWEWEGGAVALDVPASEGERPHDSPGVPAADPDAHADGAHESGSTER